MSGRVICWLVELRTDDGDGVPIAGRSVPAPLLVPLLLALPNPPTPEGTIWLGEEPAAGT